MKTKLKFMEVSIMLGYFIGVLFIGTIMALITLPIIAVICDIKDKEETRKLEENLSLDDRLELNFKRFHRTQEMQETMRFY